MTKINEINTYHSNSEGFASLKRMCHFSEQGKRWDDSDAEAVFSEFDINFVEFCHYGEQYLPKSV